jgi:hypothetical protein
VRNRLFVLVLACACMLGFSATANASQMIERNPRHVTLAVNKNGTALITYQRQNGQVMHVLAWGAVNARLRPARRGAPQVKFKIDYSGGWGSHHHQLVWKHFKNVCRPYEGPKLAWSVAACKAPNGSYWALQSWQTALPDLGFTPWLPLQSTWWLHLSHWTGPLAQLEVHNDWVYNGRWQELFGRYTYLGVGIRGFNTTHYGAPTDGYGRLLYLDTHNSMYGKGWKRENSFVSHGPPGMFCYGFYPFNPYVNGYAHPRGTPHRKRGPGTGDMYRITTEGPGVTPDVMWQGPGLHRYDRNNSNDVSYEHQMNATLDQIRGSWHKCTQH